MSPVDIRSLLYVVHGQTFTSDTFFFPPSAAAGGDHIERRRSASHPPRAAVEEEGEPGEGGQPVVRPREAGGALKEQETRQILEKGQRQTRPKAKGQCGPVCI